MPTLKILPVEYKGTRLHEVGERVIKAFYPVLDDFVVLNEIGLIELIRSAEPLSIPPNQINLQPPYNVAVSDDFLEVLLKYGEPILGVTSLPAKLKYNPNSWLVLVPFRISFTKLSGLAHHNKKSAYVSTYGTEFREGDSRSHLEILVRIAIHEVGHTFGLKHHYNTTSRGRWCPMLGGLMVQIDEYALADSLLCADCYRTLRIPEPILRT